MVILLRASSGEELELPVRPDVADALFRHALSSLERHGARRLGELSADALFQVLLPAACTEPRPPTPAQIKFALDIVRRLGVALPVGALQDRLIMGNFLTRHGCRLQSGVRRSS